VEQIAETLAALAVFGESPEQVNGVATLHVAGGVDQLAAQLQQLRPLVEEVAVVLQAERGLHKEPRGERALCHGLLFREAAGQRNHLRRAFLHDRHGALDLWRLWRLLLLLLDLCVSVNVAVFLVLLVRFRLLRGVFLSSAGGTERPFRAPPPFSRVL
jgi:hypothetical protein